MGGSWSAHTCTGRTPKLHTKRAQLLLEPRPPHCDARVLTTENFKIKEIKNYSLTTKKPFFECEFFKYDCTVNQMKNRNEINVEF